MPRFSRSSQNKLDTCDQRLQDIFNVVIKKRDCTIICGYRGEYEQNQAWQEGKSMLKFPKSKHNTNPSIAIDVINYPIDWDDTRGICFFAGYVTRVANEMGYKLKWGGDWNSNGRSNDQTFNDIVHFELID